MDFSAFQIINLVLGVILVVLFIKYIWDLLFLKVFQPQEWKKSIAQGRISPELIKTERRYKDKSRFFSWWLQVERLKEEGVDGVFAELGVYQGSSAKVLHFMDPSRRFYLFDTFEGFPGADLKGETGEAATYTERNFADTNLTQVKRFIGGNENLVFVKGRFQETKEKVENERFALVNLDADLYLPTRSALPYFYQRLSPGGVIFIHDYNDKWPGIIRAVDEFCSTIPESKVLFPDMEGTVAFIKNRNIL